MAAALLASAAVTATPIQQREHRNSPGLLAALGDEASGSDPTVPPDSPDFYFRVGVCVVLVLLGGLLAGLTLGLMSLDETNLHILATSGSETERMYAQRIQPIRKNGHWLLVTLLLGNTIINETLPIVMDSILGGGVAAIVVSTAAIVLFGEIIPQSLCARYGLAIGAFFAYPVRILQYALSPLGYPIAMLLDFVLGADHGVTYKKAELKELVLLSDTAHGGNLSNDEVTIIRGALELSEKLVVDVMTDLSNVYMVDINARLTRKLMTEMLRRGHSRVPVYDTERTNIVGVLLVKSLILLDPDDALQVREAKLTTMPLVTPNISLYDILNAFQEGGSHMAVVMGPPPPPPSLLRSSPTLSSDTTLATSKTPLLSVKSTGYDNGRHPASTPCPCSTATPSAIRRRSNYIVGDPGRIFDQDMVTDDDLGSYVPIGIITLEDVIEELIQEEIIDETDVFVDMRKRVKVVRAVTGPSTPYMGNATTSLVAAATATAAAVVASGDSISAQQKARHIPANPRSGDYDSMRRQRRGFAFSSRRRHAEAETGEYDELRPQSMPSSSLSDNHIEGVPDGERPAVANGPSSGRRRSALLSGELSDDSDTRSI
ncbi:DUF21-domain-containing protein [Linderina pennispora]|uniref:DUF21-domain-containing protein n=1 Tax=Linderina pennispora TaxID=61395 RepID=A0A1Y1W9C7_9FUNG|nr:DUF21-domain-containing protein [Linderina pennispora]ORX69856.1 DUF21-domain-containing protein [Linderina pennispora]